MKNKLKRYRVLLEPNTEPEEWNENELYGFLGTRLGTEAAAADTRNNRSGSDGALPDLSPVKRIKIMGYTALYPMRGYR
jgi:hypothetical protein